MDYAQQQRSPMRHIIGLGIVVLLHVLLIYALMNGLGRAVIDVIKPPITTKIVKEPPPPPPPPTLVSPPPPYIPPPDIQIEQPPPPHAIQTVTHAPPPTPNPAPFTAAKPLPPGPPDHSAGVRALNNVKPEFPPDMEEAGRAGTVTMSCDISAEGTTSNCAVVSVQGGQSFARSALDYVHRARFAPAVRNGTPVPEAHHVWNITYALADSEQ